MSETPGDPIFFNLTGQFLDRHIREGRAQKAAIRCGDSVRTYGDLAADVNRAGNGLLKLGLQEEQRVLLLLPDCPEFAVAYFAVMKIRAVAVPTSTFARAPDYDYFLSESEARILIVHSTLSAEVAPAISAHHFLQHVIVVGDLNPVACIGMSGLPRIRPNWLPQRQGRRTLRSGCGPRGAPGVRRQRYTCTMTGSVAAGIMR